MGSAAPHHTVIGAILAGGRGMRLGGVDKAFIIWQGEPLMTRVARRLRGHCRGIIVIANGDLGRFAPTGLAAIADHPHPTLSGARRGLATAFGLLDRAAEGAVLFTTPTDLPDLPFDLV